MIVFKNRRNTMSNEMIVKELNILVNNIRKEKIEELSDFDMFEIQMCFDVPLRQIADFTEDEGNVLDGMSW
jgi:diphthamide synthase subunit DPH2